MIYKTASLYKTAAMFKIAKVASNIEDFKEFTDIPETVVEDKKGNFVYAWARAVTADVPNGNADMFPREEIEKSYQTFIGRNMFLDHKADSVANAVGKVIAAKLMHDPEANNYYVGCLIKVCRDTHPQIAANLEAGIIDSVSMGASVERCQCNICDCEATDPRDFCEHLRTLGRVDPKTGKKHISINKGITFTELSFVSVPADFTAKIKKIFERALGISKTASINELKAFRIVLAYEDNEISDISKHAACFEHIKDSKELSYNIAASYLGNNTLTIDVNNVSSDLNTVLQDINSIIY